MKTRQPTINNMKDVCIGKKVKFYYYGKAICREERFFSYNNKLMMIQLTILLSLLLTASAVNWQAADNITESNRTFIWDTINNNVASYAPSRLAPFSEFISTTLNNQWDPAWNVFVFRLIDPTVDAIVYGYAFRNHWMWYNGYTFGGKTYSFVIWKDYNCHTWHTLADSELQTAFDPSAPNYALINKIGASINTVSSRLKYTDIWFSIRTFVAQIEADVGDSYSVAAVQNGMNESATSEINGCFCSAGGAQSFIFAPFGLMDGSSFKMSFFKTR